MVAKDESTNGYGLQKRTFNNLAQLQRHIKLVIEDTQLIGQKLIDRGECDLGRHLIANGYIHDNSKFYGIEWDHLTGDPDNNLLTIAVRQHVTSNPHHPEYWGSVEQMPKVYVAEMVCDWHARSAEFGTDMRHWVRTKAVERYNISKKGKKYKEIQEFMNLLLGKPFS